MDIEKKKGTSLFPVFVSFLSSSLRVSILNWYEKGHKAIKENNSTHFYSPCPLDSGGTMCMISSWLFAILDQGIRDDVLQGSPVS